MDPCLVPQLIFAHALAGELTELILVWRLHLLQPRHVGRGWKFVLQNFLLLVSPADIIMSLLQVVVQWHASSTFAFVGLPLIGQRCSDSFMCVTYVPKARYESTL
jgi:hypothetical protein